MPQRPHLQVLPGLFLICLLSAILLPLQEGSCTNERAPRRAREENSITAASTFPAFLKDNKDDSGTLPSRSMLTQPSDNSSSRRLQVLPKPMSTIYVVEWLLADATDCAPHFLAVDLECRTGKIEVVDSATFATCVKLAGKSWLRCTSTNPSGPSNASAVTSSSVQVQCTGDSIQALTLLAKTVPFSVICYEISNPDILVSVHRLCPNNGEYTKEAVTYSCINASPQEDGVCRSTEPVLCYVVTTGSVPFLGCGSFSRFAVMALVLYSSIDNEEYSCLLGAEENDEFQPVMGGMQIDEFLPATMASTELEDTVGVKEATYQIYFDTKEYETTTEGDCLFPAASVLLLCGSGEFPIIKKILSTSCYYIRTRNQVLMIRCFQVARGFSGSIIASCTGTSEEARELFVYMDEHTLPQCGGQENVADRVWLSVICDGDLIWGGKRQCLRSDEFQPVMGGMQIDEFLPATMAPSTEPSTELEHIFDVAEAIYQIFDTKEDETTEAEEQIDSCISSYECDKGEFQYCTGHGVIVSASADSEECLSDFVESSSSADPSPSTTRSTDPSTNSSVASSSRELSQPLLLILLAVVGYCGWVFKL